MIQKFRNLNESQLVYEFQKLLSDTDRIFVTILVWRDWDYFIQFCADDGGIEDSQEQLCENLSLSKQIRSFKELEKLIQKLGHSPFLSSRNSKYKFHYDLHIWTAQYYFIYNFHLQKAIFKRRTLISKIFSPVKTPQWQFEN